MQSRVVPLAAGAALVALAWVGFTLFAKGPPDGTPINLRVGGADCVEVVPLEAPVWKDKANGNNSNRPQRATWFVDSKQNKPKRLYRYKITEKPLGANGYLGGPYEIKCNGKAWARSDKAPDVGGASDLEWKYQIEVWKCADDSFVCKKDPLVDIMD